MKQRLSNYVSSATDTFKELFALYIGVLVVAGLFYSFFEHKGFWDAMWWAVVTALTVGYGDLYPVTVGGRIDAVILMHVVPFFIAPLVIGRILTRMIRDENEWTDIEQEEVKKNLRKVVQWIDNQELTKKGGK